MSKSQYKDTVFQKEGTIASADITGTATGQLGHANGVVIVPAGPSDSITVLESCMILNDFQTAAYGGGGNLTVNISGGGAALTGIAASFDTAAADTFMEFRPLAATKNVYTAGNGLALVDSGAPTQPGTATGVFRYVVRYRRVKTGSHLS